MSHELQKLDFHISPQKTVWRAENKEDEQRGKSAQNFKQKSMQAGEKERNLSSTFEILFFWEQNV